MRIIALIDDADVIERILKHLNVWDPKPETIPLSYHPVPDIGKIEGAGWFNTGDMAKIDQAGMTLITDRSKDVIKSGGEWISSRELESAALQHPKVAQAAAIGIPDPRWNERPLMLLVPKGDCQPEPASIREFLGDKVAKWWVPERIDLVDELPVGPTGKILKREIRSRYLE